MSRYFEYDTIKDKIPNTDFVKVDKILHPDGDLVPVKQFVEIQTNTTRRSCRLQDLMEPAITESKELNQMPMRPLSIVVSDNNDVIATNAGNDKTLLLVKVGETFNLTKAVRHAYRKYKLYSKILEKPRVHALFSIKDNLIFTKNLLKQNVLCVPREAFHNGRRVIEIIIDHAHTIIGHFGQFKTTQYIRRYFW